MVMTAMIMTMSSNRWNIAAAKAGLSRLVRQTSRGPQSIENRGNPVAGVVSADEHQRITGVEQAGDRWQAVLDLSAEIRADGGATLRIEPRRPRRSPFGRASR